MSHAEEQTINVTNESNDLSKTLSTTEAGTPAKLPYPKRVFLIIGSEFCNFFNFYGSRAILVFYLKYKLDYTENDAAVLFHIFSFIGSVSTIVGGIISDAWLGKYKSILYLLLIYLTGCIIISIGAITAIGFPLQITVVIALVLMAVGRGGMEPCIFAFGADQFKKPEQAALVAKYFSILYFTFNIGPLISTAITPILREDVHCFGENDCYSLAFGVPTIFLVIAILILVSGQSSYTHTKTSSENMILRIFNCIKHAIHTKRMESKTKPRNNLLDYSIEKYGAPLIADIRIMAKMLVLYLPASFYWTLSEQQGSRWSLQANRMNGDLGFYILKPDQIQALNPFLVLTLIPLFELIVYPILSKIGIRRPLQKMTIGGIFAGISFLITASVEFWIASSPEHSVSMLWQIPQYVTMGFGEVMFSVTGFAFSYEQSPASMKSISQSFWWFTFAIGNVILVIITKMNIFEAQAHEFILFAILMFVDMFIFGIMARNFERTISNVYNENDTHEHRDIQSTISDDNL